MDPNCHDCDSQNCRECNKGYFVNNKGTCDKCEFPCVDCTDGKICNECAKGYFHLEELGKCEKCDIHCKECGQRGCTKCSEGYFVEVETGLCGDCGLFCAECTDDSACDVCISGYFVNKFGECQPHHSECLEKGDKGCLKCPEKFFIESGSCGSCGLKCLECKDYDTCTKCDAPFVLDDEADCVEKSNIGIVLAVLAIIVFLGIGYYFYVNYKRAKLLELEQDLMNDSGYVNR